MLLATDTARNFLLEELNRRTRSNPRYSVRAFARQLKLSPGELSEILRGVRKLSFKKAILVARALGLGAGETQHLVELVHLQDAAASPVGPAPTPAERQLTLDVFRVVSDWYCFAILNLADTEGFKFNAHWIAKRLGISPTEAGVALERLERVGLLERTGGKLHVCEDLVLSPSGIPSEAVRNYHRDILRKASEAIELQAVEDRDFNGIGFAVDPKYLPEMKKDVRDFQRKLIGKYSKRGRCTEVYHLETALFRLSQLSTAPEKLK